MIDPQAKPKPYFRLMALVALMGVVSAVVTFAFMALVHEGTRPLAILMRYTGEEKEEERKEAAQHVKSLWGKVKGTFRSDRGSDEPVDEP